MTLDEFKKDPQAQRKFFIFSGAIALAILWLLFGGIAKTTLHAMTVRRAANEVRVATSPPVITAPVRMPVAPPPGGTTAPLVDSAAALQTPGALVGHFKGGAMISKQGFCTLSLEIRQEQEGKLLGYPELSCIVNPMLTGQPMDTKHYNPALMLSRANPSAAILSGSPVNGSVEFHVDKVINTNEAGCVMSSFSATPFGSNQLSVNWMDSCGGGNMMLTKERR